LQRLQVIKEKYVVKFFFKIFFSAYLNKIWRLFAGNLAQRVALSRFYLGGMPYPHHPDFVLF